METTLLMLDAIAVAVLVFSSLRNDRLRPGQPPTGPFRFIAAAGSRAPDPGKPGARR